MSDMWIFIVVLAFLVLAWIATWVYQGCVEYADWQAEFDAQMERWRIQLRADLDRRYPV